ncbi:MAG: hypothetical protein GEU99_20180 [Luteitalea sp.]|nr:hypothetical protein [Luteitalea sp.]
MVETHGRHRHGEHFVDARWMRGGGAYKLVRHVLADRGQGRAPRRSLDAPKLASKSQVFRASRVLVGVWWSAVSVLVSVTPLYGQVQTTTAIMGTVRDATGAVLPGVTVTIVHEATGVSRERVTNDAGDYSFQSLQPGTYTIRAELEGFRPAVITDREALVAIPAEVDIRLELGDVSEEITISAAGAELLNTTTAELATTIDEQLVDNMPTESRNYFDVLALAPNTSPQYLSMGNLTFGQHSLRRVTAAGSFESSGVLAGGQRDSSSNVSIDGSDASLAIYSQNVNILSSAMVKELRLQTASMSAEFGSGVNAVNVITKSGGNAFQGEGFWEHRNDNLDAKNFFTNLAGETLPEYKRNKWGGSLGGPILPNRLFFFANHEGSRLRQAVQGDARVPTAAERNGDFSDTVLPAPDGGTQPAPQLFNPLDFDPATGLRTPFPNNRIPPELMASEIQPILEFTPLPNTVIDGVPRFSGTTRTTIDEDQFSVRLDWHQSADTTVWGRYTYARRDAAEQGLLGSLTGESTPSRTRDIVVNWSEVVGPTLINDLSVSYARPTWGIGRPLDVPDVAALAGFANTSSLPGSPTLQGSELAIGTSGLFTWAPVQNTYQLKDDVTWTKGKHNLKTGFQVTERRLFFPQQSNDKGRIVFENTFTRACPQGNEMCDDARQAAGLPVGGLSFADMLLGFPVLTQIEFREVEWAGRQTYWAGYVQDSWRLHDRLTLNLGLRVERWGPWRLPRHTATGFDFAPPGRVLFALQDPLDAFEPATGLGKNAALSGDIPEHGYDHPDVNVAPRIGFSFRATENTVVRAGSGIFYAGNLNTNQVSAMQQQGGLFTFRDQQFVDVSEQVPPIDVRNLFPRSQAGAIPQAFEDPPAVVLTLPQGELDTPTVYQWSLSVQHRVHPRWSVNLDYLGSHTIHNSQRVDLNAPLLPQGDLADVPLQERRPLPGWGRIESRVPWGWSKYHSATFGVTNRQWHGLTLRSSLTWSKNLQSSTSVIGGGGDLGSWDFRNFDLWAGRSNFVPTVRSITGWTYELPWGHGRTFPLSGVMNQILGGWNLSGKAEFSDGAPVTVTTNDNTGSALEVQHADRLPGCDLTDAAEDRFEWFNTSCFAQPAFGTFGTGSAGLINAPGINNLDLRIGKVFPVSGTARMELLASFFNALNHTQLGNPVTNLQSPSFGRIGSARPARQINVELRLIF